MMLCYALVILTLSQTSVLDHSVIVSLEAQFGRASLISEASEYIAKHTQAGFWEYVDFALDGRFIEKCDREVFTATVDFFQNLTRSVVARDSITAALTLHTLTPLVASHHSLAELSWNLLCTEEQAQSFNGVPSTFVVLYCPPSFFDFNSFKMTKRRTPAFIDPTFIEWNNSRVFTSVEPLFDTLDHIYRHSEMPTRTYFKQKQESNGIPLRLPYDHVFPATEIGNVSKPIVILYSSFADPALEDWLTILRIAMDEPTAISAHPIQCPDGFPPYSLIFRHNKIREAPLSPPNHMNVQGYGVELEVNGFGHRLPPKIVNGTFSVPSLADNDLRQALRTQRPLPHHPNVSNELFESISFEKLHDYWPVFGIDILKVVSHFPHLAGLSSNDSPATRVTLSPDYVLRVDTPLGALYSRLKHLSLRRPMPISKVKDIGIQTSIILVNSYRPLDLLKNMGELFPYYAPSSVHINVPPSARNSLVAIHNVFSPYRPQCLVNGRAINILHSTWNVVSVMEEELLHSHNIYSLGLLASTSLAISRASIIPSLSYYRTKSFEPTSLDSTSSLAFSLQTTRVMYRVPDPTLYINNIETHKAFASWTSDYKIFIDYPAQDPFPQLRRNFALLVAFVDLTKVESHEVFFQYIAFIEHRVPIRLAIIPVNSVGITSKSSQAYRLARWYIWHCQHYDALTAINILYQISSQNLKLSVETVKAFVTTISLQMDHPPRDKKRKLFPGIPMMTVSEWEWIVDGKDAAVEDLLDTITLSLELTMLPVPLLLFNGIPFSVSHIDENVNELFSQEMNLYRWTIKENFLKVPSKKNKSKTEEKNTNQMLECLWEMLGAERWVERAFNLGVMTLQYSPTNIPRSPPSETRPDGRMLYPCKSALLNVSTQRLSPSSESHKHILQFLGGCENHAGVVQNEFHPLPLISHELPHDVFIPPVSLSDAPLTDQFTQSPHMSVWMCHFVPDHLLVRCMNASPVVSYPTERTSPEFNFASMQSGHKSEDPKAIRLSVGEHLMENTVPLTHILVLDPTNETHVQYLQTIIKAMTPGLSQLHLLLHTPHHYSPETNKSREERLLFATSPSPTSFSSLYLRTISMIPFNLRIPFLRLLLTKCTPHQSSTRDQSNNGTTAAYKRIQKIQADISEWIEENRQQGRDRKNILLNSSWADEVLAAINNLSSSGDLRPSSLNILKEHCLLIDSLGLAVSRETVFAKTDQMVLRVVQSHLPTFFIITNGVVRPILSSEKYCQRMAIASKYSVAAQFRQSPPQSDPHFSQPVVPYNFSIRTFNSLETFELQQRSIHLWRPLFARLEDNLFPKAIALSSYSNEPTRPISPKIIHNPQTDPSRLLSVINLLQTRHCYSIPRASASDKDQFNEIDKGVLMFDLMKGAFSEGPDDRSLHEEKLGPTLIEILAAINPINPKQRLAVQNLHAVRAFFGAYLSGTVCLVPFISPSKMPMYSLYQYNILTEPTFHPNGSMVDARKVVFPRVPANVSLSLSLKTPTSWLCVQKELSEDVSDFGFEKEYRMTLPKKAAKGSSSEFFDDDGELPPVFDVGRTKIVSAKYAIDSVSIVGGVGNMNNAPANGVPLSVRELLPHGNGSVGSLVQSEQKTAIVMHQAGCFQLPLGTPGFYDFQLHPIIARSTQIVSMCDYPLQTSERRSRIDKPRHVGDRGMVLLKSSRKGFWLSHTTWDQPEVKFWISTVPGNVTHFAPVAAWLRDEQKKAVSTRQTKPSFFKITSNKGSLDTTKRASRVNVFTVVSCPVMEEYAKVMMLSAVNTSSRPVTFWFVGSLLSPSFRSGLPLFCKEIHCEYRLVDFIWPKWMGSIDEHQKNDADRILFLDQFFPLNVERVIVLDADSLVVGDLAQLVDVDLKGRVYGMPRLCEVGDVQKGLKFWKRRHWSELLSSNNLHSTSVIVVDLLSLRTNTTADTLRSSYDTFVSNKNQLPNTERDFPNFIQKQVPITSLPSEWAWCETWCSDQTRSTAKIVGVAHNSPESDPATNHLSEMKEWRTYYDVVNSIARQLNLTESVRRERDHTERSTARAKVKKEKSKPSVDL